MSTLLPPTLSYAVRLSPALDRQAADLAGAVRELTKALPAGDEYDLGTRLDRAASAVEEAIAETTAGGTGSDQLCHLALAKAALAQLEIQLLLAVRAGRLARPLVQDLLGPAGEIGQALAERSADLRLLVP